MLSHTVHKRFHEFRVKVRVWARVRWEFPTSGFAYASACRRKSAEIFAFSVAAPRLIKQFISLNNST